MAQVPNKKTYIWYWNWGNFINSLPDEKAGQLSKAIFNFQMGAAYSLNDEALIAYLDANVKPLALDNEAKLEAKRQRMEKAREERERKIRKFMLEAGKTDMPKDFNSDSDNYQTENNMYSDNYQTENSLKSGTSQTEISSVNVNGNVNVNALNTVSKKEVSKGYIYTQEPGSDSIEAPSYEEVADYLQDNAPKVETGLLIDVCRKYDWKHKDGHPIDWKKTALTCNRNITDYIRQTGSTEAEANEHFRNKWINGEQN